MAEINCPYTERPVTLRKLVGKEKYVPAPHTCEHDCNGGKCNFFKRQQPCLFTIAKASEKIHNILEKAKQEESSKPLQLKMNLNVYGNRGPKLTLSGLKYVPSRLRDENIVELVDPQNTISRENKISQDGAQKNT